MKILENSSIKNYYFYTSLAVNDLIEKRKYLNELFDLINNSKKIHIYFSCYFDDDYKNFERITRQSKNMYNLNIRNSLFFLKNINKQKLTFIDRVNKFQKDKLLKNNKVAKFASIKGFKIISEYDDLKEKRENFLRHSAFCEQFLACETLKINGDIVYCNYGRSYYEGKIDNINQFKNNEIDINKLANNDLCKNCLYKMESVSDDISNLIWNIDQFKNNHKKETSM